MKFAQLMNTPVRNQGIWRFLPQRPRTWLLLAGALYSFTLITNVPVQWGAAALTSGTGLGLSGLSGSAFNGRATAASIQVQGKDYPLGELTWQLRPASLFSLKPCIALTTELDIQGFNGDVCVGAGSVTLKNAEINLPVAVIKDSIPLQLDGFISGNIDELQLRDNAIKQLQGTVNLRDMHGFNGSNWIALGNFNAVLGSASDAVNVKLVSIDGPVEADLAIDLLSAGGATIKGNLAMTEAHLNATNAQALMSMLGSSSKDGDKVRIAVDTGF